MPRPSGRRSGRLVYSRSRHHGRIPRFIQMPAGLMTEAAIERPTGSARSNVKKARRDPFAARSRPAGRGGNAEPGENGWSLLDVHIHQYPVGAPGLIHQTRECPPARNLSTLDAGSPVRYDGSFYMRLSQVKDHLIGIRPMISATANAS